MAPVACVDVDGEECEREKDCVTVRLWGMLNDAINNVVDQVTLEDLVAWEAEKADQYVI